MTAAWFPGLYAMGQPYLRHRGSTHIHGAQDDAKVWCLSPGGLRNIGPIGRSASTR